LPEYSHLETDKGSNFVAWKIFELFTGVPNIVDTKLLLQMQAYYTV